MCGFKRLRNTIKLLLMFGTKIQLLILLLMNAQSLLKHYFCMKTMYMLLKLWNRYYFYICLLGAVLNAEDYI